MPEIYDFLLDYSRQGLYPFHMPGHKRNPAFLVRNMERYDITEIPGADNLHAPERDGIIYTLQKRMSHIWGSDESYIMINGSSGGICAALLATLRDGDHVLVGRNAHKAFYNGVILCGAHPHYLLPNMSDFGVLGGIGADEVEKELALYPQAKAVFITSPTYEGFVSDIYGIGAVCHKHGIPLIVDEAHGAHFAFSEAFPKSAVSLGADIVINSLHKTLPFMNQLSTLHVQGNLVDHNRLRQALSMMQTTSPSYPLLAQADYALGKLDDSVFVPYTAILGTFRNRLSQFENLPLVGKEYVDGSSVTEYDNSKLVFITADGQGLYSYLRRSGLELELAGARHVIAMSTCADTVAGLEMLLKAIGEADNGFEPYIEVPKPILRMVSPKVEMSPREAAMCKHRRVPLIEAKGSISASFVTPYPPGIPVLAPGELISGTIVKIIQTHIDIGSHIIGDIDLKYGVIDIVDQI